MGQSGKIFKNKVLIFYTKKNKKIEMKKIDFSLTIKS
jgi:hypothetical protein